MILYIEPKLLTWILKLRVSIFYLLILFKSLKINVLLFIFAVIKLQLVDEGEKIIDVIFDKITLYNFIESDCHLPGQLVLDCSLNNMWFPILNVDTILMLKPYFNQELLYKVRIVKTDVSGVKLVQMIKNDTNIDISDSILQSGIGQHLCAAIKTG